MKKSLIFALAALAMTAPAHAAVYVVDALGNSSSGGTGLNTIALTSGQSFSISSSLNDLWSAGALPRYSNANGLTGNLFKSAADDAPGSIPDGTLIGIDFGLHSQGGLNAPFGALVGRIGSVYQLLGANYSGTAWGTGTLQLFYWDSNSGDNTGNIAFNVTTGVPEPATWAMMMLGFGLMGAALRRRRQTVRITYA